MTTILQDAAAWILQKSSPQADLLVEIFASRTRQFEIEIRDQQVDNMRQADEQGLGIRVFKRGSMGFSFTTDFSPQALETCLQTAIFGANVTNPEEHWGLPAPASEYPQLSLWDKEINTISIEQKRKLALELETAARSYDQRVAITESSAYSDWQQEIVIANSLGINTGFRASGCLLSIYIVAREQDDNQTGFSFQQERRFTALNPQRTGQEAARQAVAMLGAQKIPTCQVPVIFDPLVGASFLGVLAPAFSAESVFKGKSFLATKLATSINSKITLVDDRTYQSGMAAAPFDAEGVVGRRNVLIQDGLLQTWLHNTVSGRRQATASSGNAVRSSFRATPEIGTSNFFLLPGPDDQATLVGSISRGLLINEVMGMHSVNTISGDFSVGAAGHWIENGEKQFPVRGIMIAGNLLELMQNIESIGSDTRFMGGKGSPSLLIGRLTVAGE